MSAAEVLQSHLPEGIGVLNIPPPVRAKINVLFQRICLPSSGSVAEEIFEQLLDFLNLLETAGTPGDPFQNFLHCWACSDEVTDLILRSRLLAALRVATACIERATHCESLQKKLGSPALKCALDIIKKNVDQPATYLLPYDQVQELLLVVENAWLPKAYQEPYVGGMKLDLEWIYAVPYTLVMLWAITKDPLLKVLMPEAVELPYKMMRHTCGMFIQKGIVDAPRYGFFISSMLDLIPMLMLPRDIKKCARQEQDVYAVLLPFVLSDVPIKALLDAIRGLSMCCFLQEALTELGADSWSDKNKPLVPEEELEAILAHQDDCFMALLVATEGLQFLMERGPPLNAFMEEGSGLTGPQVCGMVLAEYAAVLHKLGPKHTAHQSMQFLLSCLCTVLGYAAAPDLQLDPAIVHLKRGFQLPSAHLLLRALPSAPLRRSWYLPIKPPNPSHAPSCWHQDSSAQPPSAVQGDANVIADAVCPHMVAIVKSMDPEKMWEGWARGKSATVHPGHGATLATKHGPEHRWLVRLGSMWLLEKLLRASTHARYSMVSSQAVPALLPSIKEQWEEIQQRGGQDSDDTFRQSAFLSLRVTLSLLGLSCSLLSQNRLALNGTGLADPRPALAQQLTMRDLGHMMSMEGPNNDIPVTSLGIAGYSMTAGVMMCARWMVERGGERVVEEFMTHHKLVMLRGIKAARDPAVTSSEKLAKGAALAAFAQPFRCRTAWRRELLSWQVHHQAAAALIQTLADLKARAAAARKERISKTRHNQRRGGGCACGVRGCTATDEEGVGVEKAGKSPSVEEVELLKGATIMLCALSQSGKEGRKAAGEVLGDGRVKQVVETPPAISLLAEVYPNSRHLLADDLQEVHRQLQELLAWYEVLDKGGRKESGSNAQKAAEAAAASLLAEEEASQRKAAAKAAKRQRQKAAKRQQAESRLEDVPPVLQSDMEEAAAAACRSKDQQIAVESMQHSASTNTRRGAGQKEEAVLGSGSGGHEQVHGADPVEVGMAVEGGGGMEGDVCGDTGQASRVGKESKAKASCASGEADSKEEAGRQEREGGRGRAATTDSQGGQLAGLGRLKGQQAQQHHEHQWQVEQRRSPASPHKPDLSLPAVLPSLSAVLGHMTDGPSNAVGGSNSSNTNSGTAVLPRGPPPGFQSHITAAPAPPSPSPALLPPVLSLNVGAGSGGSKGGPDAAAVHGSPTDDFDIQALLQQLLPGMQPPGHQPELVQAGGISETEATAPHTHDAASKSLPAEIAVPSSGKEQQLLASNGPSLPPSLSSVLRCGLSGCLLSDPVIAADGHTYEREALEEWVRGGGKHSPLTGQLLGSFIARPNHAVRQLINSFAV